MTFDIETTKDGRTTYLIDGKALPEPERDMFGQAMGPMPHTAFWEALEALPAEEQDEIRAQLRKTLSKGPKP